MEGLSLDVRFEKMQWWRDLEDHIMPLESIFAANLKVLEALELVDNILRTASSGNAYNQTDVTPMLPLNLFASRQNHVRSHMASAAGLQKRMHGALNLVGPSLPQQPSKEILF